MCRLSHFTPAKVFFRPDFCGRFSNAYGDLRDILMATQLNSGTLTGLSGISRRLVAEGLLGETDARKALEDASKQKIPIGAWLVENGLVASDQIALASALTAKLFAISWKAADTSGERPCAACWWSW